MHILFSVWMNLKNIRLKEIRNMSNLNMTIKFPAYVVSKLLKPMQDSIPYTYYDMFNCSYYFYIYLCYRHTHTMFILN
jgi:hypothetical protein